MAHDDQEDFAALLEEFEGKSEAHAARAPRAGDVVKGRVVSIGSTAVFVELGGKAEGVLDRDQVLRDGELTVAVGDTVEARVVEVGGASGAIVLRTQVGRGPEAYKELAQAFELGIPVDGLVSGTNKGGVEVTIAGIRAFCPVSQLDNRFVENPEDFVGRKMQFKITRFEDGRSRPNLVVSRRALLEIEAKKRLVELRESVKSGITLSGTVTQLKPFGAFVDIGGVEGMIHVSEIGHSRVADPSDVLAIGQTVDVVVLSIEDAKEKGKSARIALSLKALQDDPWNDVATALTAGSTIQGEIVRLQPFGAFIEVRPGIEGLVHISELGAGRRISHPREVCEVGQRVEVMVLSVDPSQRRISLSMAASQAAAADSAERDNVRENAPRAPKSLGTFGDLLKNVKVD